MPENHPDIRPSSCFWKRKLAIAARNWPIKLVIWGGYWGRRSSLSLARVHSKPIVTGGPLLIEIRHKWALRVNRSRLQHTRIGSDASVVIRKAQRRVLILHSIQNSFRDKERFVGGGDYEQHPNQVRRKLIEYCCIPEAVIGRRIVVCTKPLADD